MASDGGGGRSAIKYGCFGCLALVVLILLVAGTATGIALLQVRSEEVETRSLTREVPAPVSVEAVPAEPEGSAETSAATPVRVVLDISDVELRIEPGPAGEPIRVQAEYDTKVCELTESFEQSVDGAGTYSIAFRKTGGQGLGALRALMGGHQPEIRITLPAGVRLTLEGGVRQGVMEAELGGLSLEAVDLDVERGAFVLGFRDRLPSPMQRFQVDGAQGAVIVERLGNASPGTVRIVHRMGELELDLLGAWVGDADIDISLSMGGGELQLPRDVIIEGLAGGRRGLGSMEQAEIQPPTLRLNVASSMGELQIVD